MLKTILKVFKNILKGETMKKTKIKSHVRNGKLMLNRGVVSNTISKFEGKNIIITIEREKPPENSKRSIKQNAYYHGVVVKMIKMAIDDATGDVVTTEDVHDLLKGRFNFKAIHTKNCNFRVTSIPQSTQDLSTSAFKLYTEQCRMWGNDFFNIEIPEPDEDENNLKII